MFSRSGMFVCALIAVGLASGTAVAQPGGQRLYVVGGPNLCVDIAGGRFQVGTIVRLWTCNMAPAQRFGMDRGRGQIYAAANPKLCVDDIPNKGLALVDCGRTRFRWVFNAAKSEVRGSDGRCWDVPNGNFKQGVRMIIWRCHGGLQQKISDQP